MTRRHNSIWTLQSHGEANESQKNYDLALADFRRELDLEHLRPGVHYRMGRVYLARFSDRQMPEDRAAAIHEFAAELEIDPANGNAGYELGVLAQEDGNLEEAQGRFEQVTSRFPAFEEALVALGECYLRMSKPDSAVSPLERATKVEPDDEVAWYKLARAQHATGHDDASAKSMAQFRKIHAGVLAGVRVPTQARDISPQKLDAEAEKQ